MIPIPSDSVKNACPSAASTTPPLSLLQSGENMNAAASPKPAVVAPKPISRTSATISSGISHLAARSRPPLTPPATMPNVNSMKIVCQNSSVPGWPSSVVK